MIYAFSTASHDLAQPFDHIIISLVAHPLPFPHILHTVDSACYSRAQSCITGFVNSTEDVKMLIVILDIQGCYLKSLLSKEGINNAKISILGKICCELLCVENVSTPLCF